MKHSTQPVSQPETETIFELIQKGNVSEAKHMADALLAREPENPVALYLLGLIYRLNKDVGNAIAYFNKALRYKPDFRKACNDLALLLQEAGQMELAIKMFEHLIKLDQRDSSEKKETAAPLSATAEKSVWEWNNKAQKYYARGALEQALAAFRKALAISNNQHPELLINVGISLWALGRNDEAEDMLMKCLRFYPDHASALNQLGNTFKDRRYLTKAVAAYRLSHKAGPNLQQSLANLGKTYFELQLYSEAIESYEKLLNLYPDILEALAEMTYVRQMLCRWDHLPELRERIRKIVEKGTQPCEPFIAMIYVPPRQQQAITSRWSHKLFPGGVAWTKKTPLPAVARADGKLRVGYLSSDFQRHATVALINEMFTHHDRKRFGVYAYSYGVDDGGPERARVRASVDHFRDLYNINDQQACDRIQEDGIDILIDLKGFTQNHRLSLMARRPAPIQMHYLGYPGTLGSAFIDYFIADSVAAPPELDAFFTERLIRLPHSYQINDRTRELPKAGPSRAEYGLPEEGFVFCGFNNLYKITPEVFDVWMRLLAKTEGSVLWLLETQAESTQNLKREAAARGVNPDRIIPAKMTTQSEHLKRYRHADLLIDTAPVCGHTTTSDALWCGVPVVTLIGESFIGRVAASLLNAVGLPELVTTTLADYEAFALSLAQNPDKLSHLRRHLEEGRMRFTLFDSVATTRALEAAYFHAAERNKQGKPPQSFALAPDLSVV